MRRLVVAAALAVTAAWTARPALAADRVVFQDGHVLEGCVEDETATEVVVRVGTERRRYPQRLILAVHRDPALHPAPEAAAATPPAATSAAGSTGTTKSAGDGAAKAAARGTPTPGIVAEKPASPVPGRSASGSAPRADATGPAGAAAPAATVDWLMIGKLADGTPSERGGALEVIAAGWPMTRPTLEAALRHANPSVRLSAMELLEDARVTDSTAYLADLLADNVAPVRRAAVRIVRHRALPRFEPQLVQKILSDPDTGVRAESARTLEDVGTVACLHDVLRALGSESEASLRPRLIRVLRKVTGEDCRDDVEAWRAAIDRAERRAREKKTARDAK